MTNLPIPTALAAGLMFSLLVVPAQAERIPLAAHRAIYELALDPSKNTTRVDMARAGVGIRRRPRGRRGRTGARPGPRPDRNRPGGGGASARADRGGHDHRSAHVDRPERALHDFGRSLHGIVIGDIERQHDRLAAEGLDLAFCVVETFTSARATPYSGPCHASSRTVPTGAVRSAVPAVWK